MKINNDQEYDRAMERLENIWDFFDRLNWDVAENKEFRELVLAIEAYEEEMNHIPLGIGAHNG